MFRQTECNVLSKLILDLDSELSFSSSLFDIFSVFPGPFSETEHQTYQRNNIGPFDDIPRGSGIFRDVKRSSLRIIEILYFS